MDTGSVCETCGWFLLEGAAVCCLRQLIESLEKRIKVLEEAEAYLRERVGGE